MFLKDQTEPLYTLIMFIFNKFKIPFRLFLIIESIYIVFVYCWFICKVSDNPSIVILLYFIWPFCRDAVVLRTTLASTLIYIAFYIYIKDPYKIFNSIEDYNLLLKNKKAKDKEFRKNIIIFIFMVIMAGLIHFAMLFYLILIIPMLIGKSNNSIKRIIVLFCILFIAELVFSNVFLSIPMPGLLKNKLEFVLERSVENKGLSIFRIPGMMRTIFMFVLYLFLHLQVWFKYNNKNVRTRINKIFIVNLYQLLVIPFYVFIPDLTRLQ